jgi:hypothetical protein
MVTGGLYVVPVFQLPFASFKGFCDFSDFDPEGAWQTGSDVTILFRFSINDLWSFFVYISFRSKVIRHFRFRLKLELKFWGF